MTIGTVSGQTHKMGSGEKTADFYGKAAFFFFFFHFVFAHCLQKVKRDITRYWANGLFIITIDQTTLNWLTSVRLPFKQKAK